MSALIRLFLRLFREELEPLKYFQFVKIFLFNLNNHNPPSLGLEGDHLGGGDDPVEAGVGGHLGQTVARVHRGLGGGGCWVVLGVRPLLLLLL